MANHGWTILPKGKKTSPEEITSHIWYLDRARFEGQIGNMEMYRPSHKKSPYMWELPVYHKDGDTITSLQFFLSPRGTKFEWRHPHDPMLCWWLQQYIAEYVAYKLDGLVYDDGISERLKPSFFAKYPVVQDWIYRLSDLPSRGSARNFAAKIFIRDLQKNVPEDLWRVVSRTNGFEKQFDIPADE